jgi:hypothetical protein
MNQNDPVDDRLDELRALTEAASPPRGFEDLVWWRVLGAARRTSRWLAMAFAAAAAAASLMLASSSEATLADRVLALGDDAGMEAP